MAVQTVLGAIESSELGIISPHEHVFIDLRGFFTEGYIKGCVATSTDSVTIEKLGILNRDPYAIKDNLIIDDMEIQIKELLRFKQAGGSTVVDATTLGIGRDPIALKKIAIATGLNIVIGTGFYVGTTHSKELLQMEINEIANIMQSEIEIGIDGTDIRAGVIGEIGISEVFSDSEIRVLKASAIAQKTSGLGILVHINPWTTNGIKASKILLDDGIKPEKIAICHVDVENNKEYIMELLRAGIFIEFDNFGKEYYVQRQVRRSGYGLFAKDTERVTLLKQLIDKGYINQILLSCDVCLKTLLVRYGGWGYAHILENIVEMMEDEGISHAMLDIMLRENPARFLDSQT
ncbi:MAG TPA: hypothetical protein PK733_08750 [Clostridiales bacterium]|nr:hypothetical protein [Clostridiales bacterium]